MIIPTPQERAAVAWNIARLHSRYDHSVAVIERAIADATAAAEEKLRVERERNAALEKALGPFAHQATILESIVDAGEELPMDDSYHFRLAGSMSAIVVGDCRKAKRILESRP